MPTATPTPEAPAVPTGCCAPFEPSTFHEKEVVWDKHLFVRERVASLFHIPLNMGRKVLRATRKIEAANAKPAQALMLSDETSPWQSELLIDVSRPVPGAEMATLSGTFLTRVYDGPYRDAPRWAEDMERYVRAKGRRLEKLYFAYTTCPSCAKAYGHNYTVLFAKVNDAPN